MFFIFLVYISALTLEAIGSYISIIGLAAKAGFILVFLTITLDFSKIVIASVLYKHWKKLHISFRFILIPVLLFLMSITSTGTYAYLIQQFNKTMTGTEQQNVQIQIMEQEKIQLETRKKDIDNQISQLPSNYVVQRKKLTELFAKETNEINEKLKVINQTLPNAKIQSIKNNGDSGTLSSIASAYHISSEQISKIIAFLIVLVIDPLAIVLLTVANFLAELYKKEKNETQEKTKQNSFLLKRKNIFLPSSFPIKEKKTTTILPITTYLNNTLPMIRKSINLNEKNTALYIDNIIPTPLKVNSNLQKLNSQNYIQELQKQNLSPYIQKELVYCKEFLQFVQTPTIKKINPSPFIGSIQEAHASLKWTCLKRDNLQVSTWFHEAH